MSSITKTTLPAPIWMTHAGVKNARTPPVMFPKIENVKNKHYDAVVVGGGIFGVTTAYLLKQSGKRVALLEGRTISGGTTGFSTAKLSAQQGPIYSMITQKRGKKVAKDYYDMNIEGIRKVEQLMTDLNIECQYEKRPHVTWTGNVENVSTIQSEHAACLELGIPARLLNAEDLAKEIPASLNPQLGVAFDNQAMFNSYMFTTELAKHVAGDGCDVFEMSRVTNVSENPFSAITGKPGHDIDLEFNGSKLTSDHVVLGTHMPIMDRSLHFSVAEPSRSFALAVRVNPDTNRWRMMSMNADQPMRSMRTDIDPNVLVILGESSPMGEMTETDISYKNIEQWAREHFDVEEVVARWTAMDYQSVDHVPFIGYLYRGTDTIFTGTGWSKWGLAMGVSGAQLVTDLINGKENPHFDTVDARRWDLLNQFQGLAMEGSHTAKHLIGDKIKQAIAPGASISDLQPGQGSVCKVGLQTVGAYRDDDGGYHIVDPVCTHLGCNLVFNQGDRLWDCPCHASQFTPQGEVVHGPAVKPLKQIKDLEW